MRTSRKGGLINIQDECGYPTLGAIVSLTLRDGVVIIGQAYAFVGGQHDF